MAGSTNITAGSSEQMNDAITYNDGVPVRSIAA